MLRFANFIGPRTDSPLVRYLGLPLVPTILGYDPRVQLLHEDDALEVIRLAALADGFERSGTFNVGGGGVLLLSQMIRRAGRVPVPVPAPAVQFTGRAIRRTGLVDFSPEQLRLLEFGRVVDTTRLRKDFGYVPRYTTVEAFDDFVAERAGRPVVDPAAVERVERGVLGALDTVAGVASAAALPSGSGRG